MSTTFTQIVHSELDINLAVFRDWQTLTREVFELLGNRTSIGNLLVYKFHYDILKRGYNITDEEGEIQHEEEMTLRLVTDINEKYAKARKAKKQYGMSLLSYYKFEESKEDTFYWLEDDHVSQIEVVPGTKELKLLRFLPPHANTTLLQEEVDVPSSKLEDFRLLANYDTKFNQYRSWLEPIADRLVAWSVLHQQLTLLTIRDGSGYRYLLAPASYLNDSDKRSKAEAILENLGLNTIISMPSDSELGKNFEFGIKFSEGQSAVNYSEALDVILVPIAIHTGLTKEYLKGNEMGLRSSEKNRQKSNDAEVQEQQDMSDDLLWIWGNVLECELCLAGEHIIDWEIKEELDETEKLANYETAFRILNQTNWDKIGVQIEDAFEFLGLDIPIDSSLIEQYKAEKEAFKARVQEGIQEGNGPIEQDESEELPSQPEQT